MKRTSLSKLGAVLLVLTALYACKKENSPTTFADPVELSGAPPPTVCLYPIVTVSDYAGNGGKGSENGKLLVAGLRQPTAIAQSTSGAVQYVSAGNTIRKISGIYVTNLVTLPETINCLATDNAGNIYAGSETQVYKVSPTGLLLATWGRLDEPGSGNSPIARFHEVSGLAIDPAGIIYVAEYGNRLIRKIQADGTVIDFAGRHGTLSGTEPLPNGPASTAAFSFIGGIALNATGTRLYVADQFSIRLIEGGIVYTIAGGSIMNSHRYVLDGNGTSARFNDLRGITIDGAENLYVTDRTFEYPAVSLSTSIVRKIIKMPTGIIAWKVRTIAGGTNGHVNGVGSDAKFYGPHGLMINSTGTTAFVADLENNRVRKLALACSPVF